MKVEELILAKCINNEENDFVLGQLYIVDEIHIGQSSSSVRIDGIYCNSIWFKYYDASMVEIDIYKSKYSPYFKEEDKEIEELIIDNQINREWNLDRIGKKINELIKAVNSIKKGN